MKRQRKNKKQSRRSDFLQMLPERKRQCRLGKALAGIDGVCFTGGYQGVVALGQAEATLTVGDDDTITLRAAAKAPPLPVAALAATSRFPGNLRFADVRGACALIADTHVDGVAHLPETIGSLRQAMALVLHDGIDSACDPPPSPIDSQAVVEALSGPAWSAEEVVQQEDHWELRPRLRGQVTPIVLAIEPQGLRVSRTVLAGQPGCDTPAARAVAHHALQANAWLRHTRMALREGRLMAEARLHPLQMAPSWLRAAASAVATAACRVSPCLRLLAQQPLVAETYITMYCSNGEQPTQESVGG